ncbi:MAG: helix-turn-helix transcriptional regulator, partial [Brevundimonas sp.]|nr:helix-turn-helix transcriptional regulator [Brevundimonas sp.]
GSSSPRERCHDPSGAVLALQTQVWGLVRERFLELGARSGFTQAQLAGRLGIPRGQVSLYLREPHRMTLKAAARLLQAMDAGLDCRLVERSKRRSRP